MVLLTYIPVLFLLAALGLVSTFIDGKPHYEGQWPTSKTLHFAPYLLIILYSLLSLHLFGAENSIGIGAFFSLLVVIVHFIAWIMHKKSKN